MKLGSGFKKAEAVVGSKGDHPTPGGYLLTTTFSSEKPSSNKKAMLTVGFDIAEGEYAGFFSQSPKKFFQLTEGPQEPFFKGIIESYLASNPPEKLKGLITKSELDTSKLIGLKIGGCLREVEYLDNNQQIRIGIEIQYLCPVSEIQKARPGLLKTLYRGSSPRLSSQQSSEKYHDDIPF